MHSVLLIRNFKECNLLFVESRKTGTYHEYVVPKSIPITVPTSALSSSLSFESANKGRRHIKNIVAVLIVCGYLLELEI